MMKVIKIGGKEYTLEFSFEAAQNKECIDKIFKMVTGGYMAQQGIVGENTETKAELATALVNGASNTYCEMPDTVITAFYAGLMENNAVLNKAEAKKLLKQYFKENPDDESASFVGMYELIRQCMEDDGFFKLTGLEKIIKTMMAEQEAMRSISDTKTPTRKKKSTSTK